MLRRSTTLTRAATNLDCVFVENTLAFVALKIGEYQAPLAPPVQRPVAQYSKYALLSDVCSECALGPITMEDFYKDQDESQEFGWLYAKLLRCLYLTRIDV